MTEIIKTTNLTKTYGKIHAVDNLNLSIKQGEIFGFLGLNGAGKTTTIRMLLGMITPTSGQCYLQGKRIGRGNINIWNDVGYIVEAPYSYPELTVFSFLSQAISVGGLFAFGFITSWIFGREYSDRTIKDLLALPISRNTIVISKFIITVLWCLFLSIFVLVLGLIVGYIVELSGMSTSLLMEGIRIYTICSILTILLSTPVGFFASYGRGYLSPLGFIVITLILAQIIAVAGYGEFFPWSIPAIIGVSIEDSSTMIENFSIIIVVLTSLVGLVGTMLWWRYADQN